LPQPDITPKDAPAPKDAPKEAAKDGGEELRALLDAWLRCPTQPALDTLEKALRAFQTQWIVGRAGGGAAAGVAPLAKPRRRIAMADADRRVLERLADGWFATTADVPRWAWFENHELVRMEPAAQGGAETLRLTAEGWLSLGRRAPPDCA
jgi:hypothetical protein